MLTELFGDLLFYFRFSFGARNDSDTSWLSSLPRAPSPPGRVATPVSGPPSTKSPPPGSTPSAPKEVAMGSSPGELKLRRDLESARSEITSLEEKAQRVITLEQGSYKRLACALIRLYPAITRDEDSSGEESQARALAGTGTSSVFNTGISPYGAAEGDHYPTQESRGDDLITRF